MLNEQLKTQITDEGEAIADRLKDNNDYQAGMIRGYKDGYEAGGYIYADKWQEAEQRAEQYEKALREIEAEHADLNLALAAMLNGYQNLSMYQKDWFTVPKDLIDQYTKMVLEYETPKPTTDDTDNG